MVHNGSRRYGAFATMTHHSPLQTDEIRLEIHVSCGVSCKEDRITNAWVEERAFWNHWVKPEAFHSLLSETALCLYGSRSLACHLDLATSHWPSRREGFTPSATQLNYQHASTIQIYSGDGGSKPLWMLIIFYETTRRSVSEDNCLYTCRLNLKSHSLSCCNFCVG